MTEIFIAKVDSQGQIGWMVTPQIINDDGQQHDQIEVVAAGGITPQTGDYVFVQTIKNNLDFSNINQYFKANRANGVIIDIATSADGKYYLKGDRIIDGNFQLTGTDRLLKIDTGKAEVNGNSRSIVTYDELNTVIQNIATWLNAHTHVVPAAPGTSNVSLPSITVDMSAAKTDNIKTGAG